MDQQAAYAIQALALAAAAGYSAIEFYQMVDAESVRRARGVGRHARRRQPPTGRRRAAHGDHQLRRVTRARGSCRYARETAAWSPWPDDPTSLVPNWQVYQVAFDKPGNQRVTALWNGDGEPLRVRMRKNGSSAPLVDRSGGTQPAA